MKASLLMLVLPYVVQRFLSSQILIIVAFVPLGQYAGRCTRQYQFFKTNKPVRSLALSQAGISEHAVMFPVDSIKVSSSGNALEEQSLKFLNRPECKFLQHLP
jgi:hypothetical protein